MHPTHMISLGAGETVLASFASTMFGFRDVYPPAASSSPPPSLPRPSPSPAPLLRSRIAVPPPRLPLLRVEERREPSLAAAGTASPGNLQTGAGVSGVGARYSLGVRGEAPNSTCRVRPCSRRQVEPREGRIVLGNSTRQRQRQQGE